MLEDIVDLESMLIFMKEIFLNNSELGTGLRKRSLNTC